MHGSRVLSDSFKANPPATRVSICIVDRIPPRQAEAARTRTEAECRFDLVGCNRGDPR